MSSVLDFQKKTTVLIVISKPPLEWHENFLLHKRFFLFHAYEVESFYLTFDMEKHLRRRPALVKSDEIFDYYEISESDLQEDTDHE